MLHPIFLAFPSISFLNSFFLFTSFYITSSFLSSFLSLPFLLHSFFFVTCMLPDFSCVKTSLNLLQPCSNVVGQYCTIKLGNMEKHSSKICSINNLSLTTPSSTIFPAQLFLAKASPPTSTLNRGHNCSWVNWTSSQIP